VEFLNDPNMMKQSRKKFILTGLSLAGVFSFFKWGSRSKKKSTVKFLTRDGRLVEVDSDKLPSSKKRAASKNDFLTWINLKKG